MIRLPLTVEYALLGFLREGPMHGYEIHRRLSDPAGMGLVWRLKQSQLYALLRRLEEEGYVGAALEPQDTRPPRRVFQLTQLGNDAFLDWVQGPVLHGREMRLHFLAKLYFAQCEGPEVASRLIERQRTTCQSWLAAPQANGDTLPDNHAYQWLVHRFRTAQIKAILAWLDECQHMVTAAASIP
jgi:DNA-binding PadR family transcriptional regulator